MPSVEHETVVTMLAAMPRGQTIEQQRAAYDGVADMYPLADDITVETTEANGVPVDWVSAPNADDGRALLYLHGGGYVIGSRTSHRELAARLARAAAARVLLVDYRLAPENPYPAAVEDSTSCYRWLVDQGFSPARIAIGGDSAGGGLTMATLLSLRDAGVTLPAAAILLSPWVDLKCTGGSITSADIDDPLVKLDELRNNANNYAPDKVDDPLVSPLFGSFEGLPPTCIQVGTREILLDDSTRLADRLEAAGVKVDLELAEGLIHVWQQLAATSPEASDAVEKLGRFVIDAT